MEITKKASELTVGDVGIERDGYFLTCIEVKRERGLIVAKFRTSMGMTPTMRCRPATLVRVWVPDTDATTA